MGKEITFTLSTKDINRAIRELKQYRASIEAKTEELTNRVVSLLEQRVQEGFGAAVVDYYWQKQGGESAKFFSEAPDVSIGVTDEGNTKVVWASGEDAVFVEFGTGVFHNGDAGKSPHPRGAELGYTIGSYGKGLGKNKTWGFRRDGTLYKTHGVAAQMPMLQAVDGVAGEIVEIAKEVFRR